MADLKNNTLRDRYEMIIDGITAFVDYQLWDDRIVLTHAEVPPALGGKGVGTKLGYAVLDDIRAQGQKVEPRCSFIAALIKRRPEYRDLVIGS